jgi:class 3 adenylate cyclase
MHGRQRELDEVWAGEGLVPFGLGIGISTGEVAAALLGSDERLEYTVVGDTVNLAQRLQDLARPAGTTVLSAATVEAASGTSSLGLPLEPMGECHVKGRTAPVVAYRLPPGAPPAPATVPGGTVVAAGPR